MKTLCLALLLLLSGCSGICIETTSPTGETRKIIGYSFLTDRLINKLDVTTHEGSSLHVEGVNSNQTTGAEIAARTLVPILKLLIP